MPTTSPFRRGALAVSAALLLLYTGCTQPAFSRSEPTAHSRTTTYDVIVVGAGVAGLTTAKDLMRNGHSVLVLEATNRIGGRAITDTSFSVPIDLGAAWLHAADLNPLTGIVDWTGFQRAPSKLDGPVFVGSHRMLPDEKKAFETAAEATEDRMHKASCRGYDEAVADFLPTDPELRALIGGNIGPLESGAEAALTSSADSAAFKAEPDDFIRQGVGTFVERFGRDVPVQFNAPVTAIHYRRDSASGVRIETAGGITYQARRVVVTVSTGVLAAHRITFDPELPVWKWEAIHDLPMGVLNKVVFQFNGPILEHEQNSEWVLYMQPDATGGTAGQVMAFVIKPLGANIVVGFYGATQARQFESLGDKAASDYAKNALATMYGPELVAKIQDTATKVTRWGKNEWTLGAYSAALPGKSKMHEAMACPVDDRIFFAGEACGPAEFNGSLPAAFISGLKASRAVHESLAREAIDVAAVPAGSH